MPQNQYSRVLVIPVDAHTQDRPTLMLQQLRRHQQQHRVNSPTMVAASSACRWGNWKMHTRWSGTHRPHRKNITKSHRTRYYVYRIALESSYSCRRFNMKYLPLQRCRRTIKDFAARICTILLGLRSTLAHTYTHTKHTRW